MIDSTVGTDWAEQPAISRPAKPARQSRFAILTPCNTRGEVVALRSRNAAFLCRWRLTVSPDLISAVTDVVLEEIATWLARPLEPVYPLVVFDALRGKVRDEGIVRNKAVHIALGVRADGAKEILGSGWSRTKAPSSGCAS